MSSHRGDEAWQAERVTGQEILHGHRRCDVARDLSCERGVDRAWIADIHAREELVRRLHRDPMWAAGAGWEMPHIPGDDDIGVTGDRCCENVPVRQVVRHPGDEVRVAGEHGVGKRSPHMTQHPVDTCRVCTRDRPLDSAPHLFKDLGRPQRTKSVGLSDTEKSVPQTHRVERAGVE